MSKESNAYPKDSAPDGQADGREQWSNRMQPQDSRIGTVIGGKYRVIESIGIGGMGSVYRAEHVEIGRTVAVKLLHSHLLENNEYVQRFQREARVASKLMHPNAVTAFDFGIEGNNPYLVMPYVEGRLLKTILLENGPLSLEKISAILTQIGGALDDAHDLGIVHRDLKPDNIMILNRPGKTDWAWVLDFGIAKPLDPLGGDKDAGITRTGMFIGTPQYMAPEQALGQPVDLRTDIYALGIILFQMLTGDLPFKSSSPVEVLMQHVHAEPFQARSFKPELNIPESVSNVVQKALSKEPANRHQSVRAMVEDFNAAMRGDTVAPAGASKKPSKFKIPAPAIYGAVSLIAAVGIGGYIYANQEEAPSLAPKTPVTAKQIAADPSAKEDRRLDEENSLAALAGEDKKPSADAELENLEQADRARRAAADSAKADAERTAAAEKAKAEQARIETAKAEQQRLELEKQELAKAEQARIEQAKIEQAKIEQARLEQARLEQVKLDQANAERAKADAAAKRKADDDLVRLAEEKLDAEMAARAALGTGTQTDVPPVDNGPSEIAGLSANAEPQKGMDANDLARALLQIDAVLAAAKSKTGPSAAADNQAANNANTVAPPPADEVIAKNENAPDANALPVEQMPVDETTSAATNDLTASPPDTLSTGSSDMSNDLQTGSMTETPAVEDSAPKLSPAEAKKEAARLFGEGQKLLDAKEYEAAAPLFEQAIALRDSYLASRLSLSMCYIRMSRFDSAREQLEKALASDKNYAPTYYNFAVYYAAAGDTANALDSLKTATKLYPKAKKWAKEEADFAALQSDPAFQALVK